MKRSNPIFSLKNFRSFGEEGAEFELAPITILTGSNCAGKSSLVKALVLLSQQSKEKNAYTDESDPVGAELPVFSNELGLGTFDNILNKSAKEKVVEFKYTLFSDYLNDYVRVIKKFRPQNIEILKYGELSSVRIEKIDGTIIYGYGHGEENDLNEIKNPLYDTIFKNCLHSYFDQEIISKSKKDKDVWTQKELDEESVKLLKEILLPPFISHITYIDSSSALIKRIYSIDDNDKVSVALRNLYNRIRSLLDHEREDGIDENDLIPLNFIKRWIREFGIGENIDIRPDEVAGLGQYIYLIKEGKERLLADEGYGITQLFALLLQIENNLPNHDSKERNKPRYICIEEPEVHLHPKFQSLLANMFVEAYKKYNIRFIIETHSEYLIRKLQVMVADKSCSLSSSEVSINYVEKKEAAMSTNRQIRIMEDGRLTEPFGPGFFDEADNLSMEIMKHTIRRR